MAKESRDFVFIDDVIQATILGLERGEASGEIFNVGSGSTTDVLTVAEQLILNYEMPTKINITGNFRLGDIRHNFADLEKIKTLLGYCPHYNFSSGIKLFCDWVMNQEIIENNFEESLSQMKSKGMLK